MPICGSWIGVTRPSKSSSDDERRLGPGVEGPALLTGAGRSRRVATRYRLVRSRTAWTTVHAVRISLPHSSQDQRTHSPCSAHALTVLSATTPMLFAGFGILAVFVPGRVATLAIFGTAMPPPFARFGTLAVLGGSDLAQPISNRAPPVPFASSRLIALRGDGRLASTSTRAAATFILARGRLAAIGAGHHATKTVDGGAQPTLAARQRLRTLGLRLRHTPARSFGASSFEPARG